MYLNPYSGIINLSVNGILCKKHTTTLTRAGILYHIGGRLLNGYKAVSILNTPVRQPANVLNGFLTAGVYLQTGAWERGNRNNTGICWLILRLHACTNAGKVLDGAESREGLITGYSAGLGIEINGLLNLKTIYYKYSRPVDNGFAVPLYQFSLTYSVKN